MAGQTESGELLAQFQAKVDEFAKFQEFIAKAEAQAARFAPEVVEKVISSNKDKAMTVVEALIPLTMDVESRVSDLVSDKASIQESTKGSDLAMQELELRKAIGEIEDDDFDKESESLRSELDSAGEKIEGIDAELATLTEALERWTTLGTEAGVLAEPEPEPEPEPEGNDEGEAEAEAESDSTDEADADEDPLGLEEGEFELELEPADEDLDDLDDLDDPLADLDLEGDDDGSPPTIQIMPGDGDVLEEDDLVLTAGVDDIVEIIVDDDDDDDDGDSDDDDGSDDEIEIDDLDVDLGQVGLDADASNLADDMSSIFEASEDQDTKQEEVLIADDVLPGDDGDLDIIHPDEPLQMEEADGPGEMKPRRAVLLYAEATPEEQVHPVTKDVVSIGRGRDNDIQVRNDSKVSRYHCKIYRRGPNYYIEDNKSANGSLVNGELITERRLFGGEEIIIGETFFRFRILD